MTFYRDSKLRSIEHQLSEWNYEDPTLIWWDDPGGTGECGVIGNMRG